MKEKIKERKLRKHVYGIHDLLFLPLVIGSVFIKDEKIEKKEENRRQLVDLLNEELDEVDQKLDTIISLEEKDESKDEALRYASKVKELSSFKEELILEDIKTDLDEVELQITSLMIDECEEDNLEIMVEDRKTIDEYREWLDDQEVIEKMYDLKEKEIDVTVSLEEKPKVRTDQNITFKKPNQNKIKDMTEQVKRLLDDEQNKLNRLQEEIRKMSYSKSIMKVKFEFTNRHLLQNIFMFKAISKSSLPSVEKFVLKTVLLSRMMRMNRKVIEDKEDKNLLTIDWKHRLKAIYHNVDYAKTMLSSALYQSRKMKKTFQKEFSIYQEQFPLYDKFLKEFDKMEKDLLEQEKKISSMNKNIEKQMQKKY